MPDFLSEFRTVAEPLTEAAATAKGSSTRTSVSAAGTIWAASGHA
jgi:hypothetical protein